MEQEHVFYPIDKMPIFEKMLDSEIENAIEIFTSFNEGQAKPHVFNDNKIDHGIRHFTEKLEFFDYREQQGAKWAQAAVTAKQKQDVERYIAKSKRLRELTEKALPMLNKLRQGTINRIIAMDDLEMGLKVAMGDINLPE